MHLIWLTDTLLYPVPKMRGDTFPITWAEDDRLYTSAGDPSQYWEDSDPNAWVDPYRGTHEFRCGFGNGIFQTNLKNNTATETGLDVQVIDGTPPGHVVQRVRAMPNLNGVGGHGPKPSGMLAIDGKLYLAFQNLLGNKPAVRGGCQHGSDAAIIVSSDCGKTWDIDPYGEWELRRFGPMFPGPHFGGPAFVQHGRGYADAIDGFVYAVSAEQWDNGTSLRVGRVPRDRILERAAWEFVAGIGRGGRPEWAPALADAAPVLSRTGRISMPDMVYIKHLDCYLLATWSLVKDFNGDSGSRLSIYRAPRPWGPFELIHEDDPWLTPEHTPYNPRLPLKWFDPVTNRGWLLHSGTWSRAHSKTYYRVNVRQFQLHL